LTVGVERGMVGETAVEGLAVGIEQQLARIAAQTSFRVVRSVYPEPVPLSGADARQVRVPDMPVDLVQPDPGLAAVLVDQAQFDRVGDLGEQREIGSGPV